MPVLSAAMSGGMNDVVNSTNKYVQLHVLGKKNRLSMCTLKKSTPLRTMMHAYCRLVKRSVSELQFQRLNDGYVITETDTGASLQLENGSEIKALILVESEPEPESESEPESEPKPQQQQKQPSSSRYRPQQQIQTEVESIVVRVLGTNDTVTRYRVEKDKPLGKLMHAYCNMVNISIHTVRFRLYRHAFGEEATPASLQMKNNDCIEIFYL